MTVKQKQWQLWLLGYYDGSIDGIWGRLSVEATKELQRDYGLIADGIFAVILFCLIADDIFAVVLFSIGAILHIAAAAAFMMMMVVVIMVMSTSTFVVVMFMSASTFMYSFRYMS